MACLDGSCLFYSVSVATLLLGLLYVYLRRTLTYWQRKNVPYLEPILLFGNLKDAILRKKTMNANLQELYTQLGTNRYGGIYMMHNPVLLVKDPELIKTIFVKNASNFHSHSGNFSEEHDPLHAKTLINLKGERWKLLRTKLSPTFTSGKMKRMFHLVLECGEALKDYLVQPASLEEIVEFKDIFAKYTTDVIASCAFGIQCNSFKDPNDEFRRMGKKLLDPPNLIRGIKMFVLAFLPPVAKFFRLAFVPDEVAAFFRRVVKETTEYREKNGVIRNDFLDLLIQLKKMGYVEDDDEEEEESKAKQTEYKLDLTDDDLIAQALLFFIGGFETSSTTMTFTAYELAVNPEIQHRVAEEIDQILQKNDGALTYESLMSMEYLDKVIAETLRKHPPIPFVDRMCSEHFAVPDSDLVLEAGSAVQIIPFALHHDPKHFPNPEKFDPSRFDEEEKMKRHYYAYLPFGGGPRMCIGNRFAQMQMKIGLVSLLSKYELLPSEKDSCSCGIRYEIFLHSHKWR